MKNERYYVFIGSCPWSENLPKDYRMTILCSRGKVEFCKTSAIKHLRDMQERGYSGYLELAV